MPEERPENDLESNIYIIIYFSIYKRRHLYDCRILILETLFNDFQNASVMFKGSPYTSVLKSLSIVSLRELTFAPDTRKCSE